MQSEPLLISSAKIGVLKRGTLSRGDILLLFFGLVFVIVGAADLFGRVFAPQEAAVTQTEDTVPQMLVTHLQEPFIPTRIEIPSLHVNAQVESVGRKEDGTMKSPSRFDTTAWFNEGPQAGAEGNAVIAGHLNNALDTSGIFEHMDNLQLGDTIEVSDATGKVARYVVRQMAVYDTNAAPNNSIFSTSGPARLVLITCNGAWDKGKKSYDKRLVVYADLQSGN